MSVSDDIRDLLNEADSNGTVSFHLPTEVDKTLGEAYRKLITFKTEMDEMEEIPSSLRPLYKEATKAMDLVRKARESAHQLRMKTRRWHQKHRLENLEESYTVQVYNDALRKTLYRGTFDSEDEAAAYAKREAGRTRKFMRYTVYTGKPKRPGKATKVEFQGTR